jgi:cytochrome c553
MNKYLACLILMVSAPWIYSQGDVAKGKQLTATCAACHSTDGNSLAADFPKLAGQNTKYLLQQMLDIQSGKRPVPTMTGMLDNLTLTDLQDIAAFYASQTTTIGQVKLSALELGQTIYRAGNSATHVPACAACHSPTGAGYPAAGFPKLSGQHAAYIVMQLKAFRAAGRADHDGQRRDNDTNGMMRTIAARMNDDEISAVASYISGLY